MARTYTTENVKPVAYSLNCAMVTPPRRERAIDQIMKRYELDRDYAVALLESGMTLDFNLSLAEQGIEFDEVTEEDTAPEVMCLYVDYEAYDYVIAEDTGAGEEYYDHDKYKLITMGTEDVLMAYMQAHPLPQPTLGGVPPEAPNPEMHHVENQVMSSVVSHPTQAQLIELVKSWKHDAHFMYALLEACEGEALSQCGEGSNLFKVTFRG